jgi:hypothetical protein
MPVYLPAKNKGTMAIAVCDRCNVKMYLDDLKADGNSPGLRVCSDCWDVKDPWRLPARKTENITVKYPRPDTDIATEI